jgi:hypothetical protein
VAFRVPYTRLGGNEVGVPRLCPTVFRPSCEASPAKSIYVCREHRTLPPLQESGHRADNGKDCDRRYLSHNTIDPLPVYLGEPTGGTHNTHTQCRYSMSHPIDLCRYGRVQCDAFSWSDRRVGTGLKEVPVLYSFRAFRIRQSRRGPRPPNSQASKLAPRDYLRSP